MYVSTSPLRGRRRIDGDMLVVLWASFQCSLCGWTPSTSNDDDAYGPVKAHIQSHHQWRDLFLFTDDGDARLARQS
jgi:hypothetical protein